MKRLNDTAAGSYEGPQRGDTRWVQASSVLGQPFVLLSANIGHAGEDPRDKAYLHVMFEQEVPEVQDSMGDPIGTVYEYTISSSGAAMVEVVRLLTAEDFPIKSCVIAGVKTINGYTRHELKDLEDWSRLEAERAKVDEIPF